MYYNIIWQLYKGTTVLRDWKSTKILLGMGRPRLRVSKSVKQKRK